MTGLAAVVCLVSLPGIAALQTAPSSAPYSWRNVEIVGGGFVTGVITHPKVRDLVYARTDIGGAYRWNPRTGRWVPLMDWITRPDWNLYGVESLAVDPTDPNRVYVAAGTYDNDWGGNGAMLASTDRGATWHRFDLPFKNGGNMPGRSIGERLAVDPKNPSTIFFGTRNAGLWRSRDHGLTWHEVQSFPKPAAAPGPISGPGWDRIPPDGHGVGWVVFAERFVFAGIVSPSENLYRSADRGESWQLVPGHPKGLLPHQAKVTADGKLVIVYGDAPGPNGVSDGAVWVLDPESGSWEEITPEEPGPGNTFGYGGVAVDARAPGTIMVSTLSRWSRGDTVFRTTDGGRTWISLRDRSRRDASRAPYLKWGRAEAEFGHWIGDVEIDPHNPDRAWYVTGATIWGTDNLRAADRGQITRWFPRAEGLEETAALDLVSPPEGAHVVSALGDIAGFAHFDLNRSPEGGMWTNPTLANTDDVDYAGLLPRRFVRVGRTHGSAPHYGAVSEDGARTWTPLVNNVPGRRSSGTVAISADGSRIVWAPEGGPAHWTGNNGVTWFASIGAPADGRVVSDKRDPRRFYILHQGRLFVSQNRGISFEPAAGGLPLETGRLVPAYDRSGRLWLPGKADGLWVSDDAGRTFRKLTSVDVAESVGLGRPAPGRSEPAVYLNGTVGGVIGVFRSLDAGRTWAQINDASTGFGTMNVITGDPKIFGRVYLGTNGRGVLVADPRRR